MRSFLILLLAASVAQAEWRVALPGWKYEFPRDHGNHPEFKTEWWYFTGNVRSADGREFGYQLTFFRQGLSGGREDMIPLSRFVTRDLKLAHFTVSDLGSGKFFFDQKFSRGAFDDAGFQQAEKLVWIDNWSCDITPDGSFHLRAKQPGASIDLHLVSQKSPVIHGEGGVSQKAEGEGRASHYYSLTRLKTSGEIRIGETGFAVEGLSWFDHEWATNQLSAAQKGWDWLSLQFDDGSELMLFQLRLKAGGRDAHSGGTFVDAAGRVTRITNEDFTLTPGRLWKNTQGVSYPVEWSLKIPRIDLSVNLSAALDTQELALDPIRYWEGAVRAEGTRRAAPTSAKGYLEMTGYAGGIAGLQAP